MERIQEVALGGKDCWSKRICHFLEIMMEGGIEQMWGKFKEEECLYMRVAKQELEGEWGKLEIK